MDTSLQTILHLYGEAPGPVPAGDPDAAALAEARFWMDHRPRVRPDAATLSAIFEAAAPPAPLAPGVRTDRAPVARRRLRRAGVVAGLLTSVTLAVAVVVPLVWAPAALVAPPAAAVSVPPAAPAISNRAAEAVAEITPAAAPESAPAQQKPASAALAWEGDRARLDALARKTAQLRARLDSTLWQAPGADLTLGSGAPGRFTPASAGGQ